MTVPTTAHSMTDATNRPDSTRASSQRRASPTAPDTERRDSGTRVQTQDPRPVEGTDPSVQQNLGVDHADDVRQAHRQTDSDHPMGRGQEHLRRERAQGDDDRHDDLDREHGPRVLVGVEHPLVQRPHAEGGQPDDHRQRDRGDGVGRLRLPT